LHPGAAQRSMRRASRAAQRGGSEAAPRAALRELPWCSRGRGAQIARGVIGVVVTFHYPLNHHPARLAAEHLEGFWFGWTSISRAFSVAQTCVFVAASLGVAMVVRAAPARAGAARALAGRARAVQRRRMLGFVPALGPHHERLEAHAPSWACIRSRLGRTHGFGLQRAHRARRAGWPLPKEAVPARTVPRARSCPRTIAYPTPTLGVAR
jgi:hypothetical protein